jgi:hypothetical protein
MTPVATSTPLAFDPAISNKDRLVWESVTDLHGAVDALPDVPTGVNNCGDISLWTGGVAALFLKTTCD